MDAMKADHGFSLDSRAIQWLVDVLCEFDQMQQRLFLQFITGAPKLPIGGFKGLTPPLTVVCKTSDAATADKYLPSVMTCVNYLKLPQYSSEAVMKERLLLAMSEGQGAFHLS
jgi:E3 ubiquitin-protein ligase TRIP12